MKTLKQRIEEGLQKHFNVGGSSEESFKEGALFGLSLSVEMLRSTPFIKTDKSFYTAEAYSEIADFLESKLKEE